MRLSAAALPVVGLAAACAKEAATPGAAPVASAAGTAVIRLPSPGNPVTLPLYPDNPVVADGPLEAGPLKIYQWKSYLYDDILDEFRRRYDVDLVVRNFDDMDEAVTKIRSGKMADFDVFFPSIGMLGPMVHEGLLRPLNHDLLPNMANLWEFFRSPAGPFYDVGQRYTVPYTIYGTGIAWNSDLLDRRAWPTELANPYDAFWRPGIAGPRVGFYDDYREALALALLRNGVDDVNTSDPTAIEAAAGALVALGEAGVTRGDDGAYEGIPEGTFKLHQSWSGDILSASAGERYPEAAEFIRYLWPKGGVVGADLTGVLADGANPRLAHAFVDFLMEPEIAWENYSWNGYQPPVAVPDTPQAQEWKPEVPTVTLDEADLDGARWLVPLEPQVDALWRQAWQRVAAATESQED